MKLKIAVVKNKVEDIEYFVVGDNYFGYGVQVLSVRNHQVLDEAHVQYLSHSKQEVERFAHIIARAGVHPVHLQNIVEDELYCKIFNLSGD